jgi:hypothetical protein
MKAIRDAMVKRSGRTGVMEILVLSFFSPSFYPAFLRQESEAYEMTMQSVCPSVFLANSF